MRINRGALWGAIHAYAEACGGDVSDKNTNAARVTVERDIAAILDDFRGAIDDLALELGTASQRADKAEQTLRDIGEASCMIKNTSFGDALLIPVDLSEMIAKAVKTNKEGDEST